MANRFAHAATLDDHRQLETPSGHTDESSDAENQTQGAASKALCEYTTRLAVDQIAIKLLVMF